MLLCDDYNIDSVYIFESLFLYSSDKRNFKKKDYGIKISGV